MKLFTKTFPSRDSTCRQDLFKVRRSVFANNMHKLLKQLFVDKLLYIMKFFLLNIFWLTHT